MWSARSMTGMGGCSLIHGKGRGDDKNENLLLQHLICTSTWTNTAWTTGWVKLPVEPWGGCRTVRVHFVQQCMKTRRERTQKSKQAGDVWWHHHAKWGGQRWAGTAMHMSDWVSMLLEGSRRQTSLWLNGAPLVTEVGSEREPTSPYKSVTLSLPTDWKKKKPWLVTSQNSFLWKSLSPQ